VEDIRAEITCVSPYGVALHRDYRRRRTLDVGPDVKYEWDGNELTFPVGLGGGTLIQLGKLPVKIGAESYYHADKPDAFGPEWGIRFLFVPVIPSSEWSERPLSGS
jgi:hypothetical protein